MSLNLNILISLAVWGALSVFGKLGWELNTAGGVRGHYSSVTVSSFTPAEPPGGIFTS